MTHKQFKPETTALVLIDYQVGTLQLIKTLSSDQSLRNAVMLAKAAKALGMPVVLTTSQEDKIQGPLPPAFKNICPAHTRAAFNARESSTPGRTRNLRLRAKLPVKISSSWLASPPTSASSFRV
jgi:nicotinamidase-related amidase